MKLRLLGALGALSLVLAPVGAGEPATTPEIHAEELLGHIKRLASDEWEGRGTGKPGEQKATAYIAAHFEGLGLEPAGENGGFFQKVTVSGGYKVLKDTALKVVDGPAFELNKEFYPFSASSSATVEGELVFAGYGITAPNAGYDDYAELDVQGKIVVVFRRAPRAPAATRRAIFQRAPFLAKLEEAAKRGAIGLIIVNNLPGPAAAQQPRGRRGRRGPPRDVLMRQDIGGEPRIPFVHMTLKAGQRLFPVAFGKTAEELDGAIHAQPGGAPRPASVGSKTRVRIAADIEHIKLHGRNVCALLRAGAKDAVDEIVVVGAHHDHVGIGGRGSMARTPEERKQIHNGADDNASGSAGVMEVAEYLVTRRATLRRHILFLTFTGEELGLLGSRHFVNNPTRPLKQMVAMINMDMIGRLGKKKLFIGGVKTSPAWAPMLDALTKEAGVDAVFGDGGRAPSDNTSFYNKKMPVLFFFTGLHREYHRPADDWPLIDTAGIQKVARLAAVTAERVANLPQRPKFQRADTGGMGPPRAVLGINIAPAKGGVAIRTIVPNGPAAKAGIRQGDVIIEIAGAATPDPAKLREVMRQRKPGEDTTVKVRRGEETLEFKFKLGRG